jgi:small multidrug resistance pump
MAWIYLCVAIFAEVVGTVALKYADGFSRPLPVIVVVIGYGTAFVLLSKAVKFLPLAVTYAIWAGAGVGLVGLLGWILFGQRLDIAALIGIGLIIAGVVVIAGFSKVVIGQ